MAPYSKMTDSSHFDNVLYYPLHVNGNCFYKSTNSKIKTTFRTLRRAIAREQKTDTRRNPGASTHEDPQRRKHRLKIIKKRKKKKQADTQNQFLLSNPLSAPQEPPPPDSKTIKTVAPPQSERLKPKKNLKGNATSGESNLYKNTGEQRQIIRPKHAVQHITQQKSSTSHPKQSN
jgi:hypothetical protein